MRCCAALGAAQETIRQQFEDAKKAKEDAEKARQEYQDALAETRREITRLREEATAEDIAARMRWMRPMISTSAAPRHATSRSRATCRSPRSSSS